MTEKLKTTASAIKAGQYDYQRIGSVIVSLCLMVEGLHASTGKLPPMVAPIVASVAPWAWIVGFLVSGTLVKLGKPVLVRPEE